ncbi:MAG: hypothetical protein K2X35_01835 [Bryobacteraceae bacterium]|nr:hypothetical protein [Bryobacteraceae bacterium]
MRGTASRWASDVRLGWVLIASLACADTLREAVERADAAAARKLIREGAEIGEAYELALKKGLRELAAEMEAAAEKRLLDGFRIERVEAVEARQNFLSLAPGERSSVLRPETRTPPAGSVFLVLDVVMPHPYPRRLTKGNLMLLDGAGGEAAPHLPWDGYVPVQWSPVETWDSVNGEEEEVRSDRRKVLFVVKKEAAAGSQVRLFGRRFPVVPANR